MFVTWLPLRISVGKFAMIDENNHKKTFAVGDIHGCYHKLVDLMARLPFDKACDRLIFLGDYINRGPETAKVIEYLLELQVTCREVIFLKGNHEQALVEYAETGDPEALRYLRQMGLEKMLEGYNASVGRLRGLACLPAEHQAFLRNLKFGVIYGKTIFTHADINEEMLTNLKGVELVCTGGPTEEAALLSSRRLVQEEFTLPGYLIVFGHIPFSAPLVRPDRIGIDTGAVYGNVLTALELPARRFYHA
jgi:serine/threonine protein phosphatase 1